MCLAVSDIEGEAHFLIDRLHAVNQEVYGFSSFPRLHGAIHELDVDTLVAFSERAGRLSEGLMRMVEGAEGRETRMFHPHLCHKQKIIF